MVVHPLPQPHRARIDARFLDPRYPEWRRQMGMPPDEHTGIDINLVGTSGNNDLGYPVVAVADGVVVVARWYRVWGNIVLIHHPDIGVWTQYAHLHRMCVESGDYVKAGGVVGSIGKGDPAYKMLAHLHFEVRRRNLPANYWPGRDRTFIFENYIDPEQWLRTNVKPWPIPVEAKRLFVNDSFVGDIERASVVADKLYVALSK